MRSRTPRSASARSAVVPPSVGTNIRRDQLELRDRIAQRRLQVRSYQHFFAVRIGERLVGQVVHHAGRHPFDFQPHPLRAVAAAAFRARHRSRASPGALRAARSSRCGSARRLPLKQAPAGSRPGTNARCSRTDRTRPTRRAPTAPTTMRIQVGEFDPTAGPEIFVADIAPAHDGDQVVRGEGLVAYAMAFTREKSLMKSARRRERSAKGLNRRTSMFGCASSIASVSSRPLVFWSSSSIRTRTPRLAACHIASNIRLPVVSASQM